MKDLRYNRPFSYGIGIDFKEARIDWKPTTDFLIKNSVKYWDYMNVQIDADNKYEWTTDSGSAFIWEEPLALQASSGRASLWEKPPPRLSAVVTIFSHRKDLGRKWSLLGCIGCVQCIPCFNSKLYCGIDFETTISVSGNETLLETEEFVIAVPVKQLRIPGLYQDDVLQFDSLEPDNRVII
jgi:hypothetical protein